MENVDGAQTQPLAPNQRSRIQRSRDRFRICADQAMRRPAGYPEITHDDDTYVAEVRHPWRCLTLDESLQHGDARSAGGFAVVVGTLDLPIRANDERGAMVPRIMEFAPQIGHKRAGSAFIGGSAENGNEPRTTDLKLVAEILMRQPGLCTLLPGSDPQFPPLQSSVEGC